MELQWGFLLPDGEILEGSGISEFPDHRFLASEYFTAQGDPDTGDPESVALTAGWIAYVIDSGEFRLKMSRLPGEDSAWPLNNAISAVERLRERYGVEPVIVTVHMFTAAGLGRPEPAGEPPRMYNPRRKRNDKYWTSGDQIISWGFVHPYENKPVDGRTVRGVKSHDELAVKFTRTRSIQKAFRKLKEEGWIRYIVYDDGGLLEVSVEAYDMPGEAQEEMADRIMTCLRRIINHVGTDPYRFIVDSRHGHVVGYTMSEVRRKLEELLQPVF